MTSVKSTHKFKINSMSFRKRISLSLSSDPQPLQALYKDVVFKQFSILIYWSFLHWQPDAWMKDHFKLEATYKTVEIRILWNSPSFHYKTTPGANSSQCHKPPHTMHTPMFSSLLVFLFFSMAKCLSLTGPKAASLYANCDCQCSSLTFQDKYSHIQGNCNR